MLIESTTYSLCLVFLLSEILANAPFSSLLYLWLRFIDSAGSGRHENDADHHGPPKLAIGRETITVAASQQLHSLPVSLTEGWATNELLKFYQIPGGTIIFSG
jgi:hypothetical protein